MDRLTKPFKGTPRGYIIAACENCTERPPHCDEECCYAESDIVGKLGNYEDTGLTPEEISMMKARLEQVDTERRQLGIALDKAIEKMRNMGWCTGCKHFKGLKGCGIGELKNCNDDNDLYIFFGLEDTTCG